jgi:hypothetical protein
MTKRIALAAVVMLALGAVSRVGAKGRDVLVRFDGGIGVDPIGSVGGVQNQDGSFPEVFLNIVRGVRPAGGAWRIGDLRASVEADGRISVRGDGLLLAGGNRIGQSLQLQVGATLICEAAAPFVERVTANLVTLDVDGDFRIDDTLTPPPPSDCASPVLLIRTNGNGAWLAAGIPSLGRY